jgi:hypothetical protein
MNGPKDPNVLEAIIVENFQLWNISISFRFCERSSQQNYRVPGGKLLGSEDGTVGT